MLGLFQRALSMIKVMMLAIIYLIAEGCFRVAVAVMYAVRRNASDALLVKPVVTGFRRLMLICCLYIRRPACADQTRVLAMRRY
ncbi:hypothetical protein BC835DRAFT_1376506 [Cytidiella melzeri]|nr:hypothetical protein BC835DRAFT_1376506 [Cytidiella melzeri]